MNAQIDVDLTYKQARALSELGMSNMQECVKEFNTTEARIRTNVSRIGMATTYILKHSNSPFKQIGNKLVLVIEDLDGLLENELVERYYLSKSDAQKQRLALVKQRAEFLLEYWNKTKTNEIVASYPQEMVDNVLEFMEKFE